MEVRFLPPEPRGRPCVCHPDRPPSMMWVPRRLDARLAENTKRSPTLAAVILAAGKGKRLKSQTPKVLHPICGRPALWHVLRSVSAARPTKIVVVVGHGADEVRDAVRSWGVRPAPIFVEQTELLGTGHAMLAAQRAVGRASDILVAGGDFDPIAGDDVKRLVQVHRRTKSAATIFVTELDEPGGYARVTHERGRLQRIVEGVDAPADLRASNEVSPLTMVFRRTDLFRALPAVGRENRQGEYYLNEVLPILMGEGERVSVVPVDTGGTFGVNSRGGLAAVERVVRARINEAHMANGVTIVDPAATYIDVDVEVGRDTVVLPMSFIEGATLIGSACSIGPSTRIVDSTIGDGSEVTFAVVLGSLAGKGVRIGPFTRLRPGTVMADASYAGPFSDIKNATIGKGSKVPHLAYVGDATLGRDVNVGAGTITVNFDGFRKYRTVIGDGASIGSDTMLIAPVEVGRNANTGAGSVISEDVPSGALGIERGQQTNVRGYRRRKEAQYRGKGKS
jgi:bifunctional UDP-N-acetylglucosamine pyrophosphorylase / glucosamine-1-phosphate N-acetyltransferase